MQKLILKTVGVAIFSVLCLNASNSLAGEPSKATNVVKVLNAWNPHFALYQRAQYGKPVQELFGKTTNPGLQHGDFNGDGIPDFVAMGFNTNSPQRTHLVVAFSTKKGHKVIALEQRPYMNPQDTQLFFNELKPGLNTYFSVLENSSLTFPKGSMKSDIFQIEIFGGRTRGFMVRGEKVEAFTGVAN